MSEVTRLAVKETPLLMRPELVRATLDDIKTNTRRLRGLELVNENPGAWAFDGFMDGDSSVAMFHSLDRQHALQLRCPYGGPLDHLWIREAWRQTEDIDGRNVMDYKAGGTRLIRWKDSKPFISHGEHRAVSILPKWRPSIHMPRWASRLTLKITGVRVERIQAITIDDIGAEGVQMPCTDNGLLIRLTGKNLIHEYLPDGFFLDKTPLDKERIEMVVRANFASTWDTINGKGSWESNPWVWAIAFRRLPGADA